MDTKITQTQICTHKKQSSIQKHQRNKNTVADPMAAAWRCSEDLCRSLAECGGTWRSFGGLGRSLAEFGSGSDELGGALEESWQGSGWLQWVWASLWSSGDSFLSCRRRRIGRRRPDALPSGSRLKEGGRADAHESRRRDPAREPLLSQSLRESRRGARGPIT